MTTDPNIHSLDRLYKYYVTNLSVGDVEDMTIRSSVAEFTEAAQRNKEFRPLLKKIENMGKNPETELLRKIGDDVRSAFPEKEAKKLLNFKTPLKILSEIYESEAFISEIMYRPSSILLGEALHSFVYQNDSKIRNITEDNLLASINKTLNFTFFGNIEGLEVTMDTPMQKIQKQFTLQNVELVGCIERNLKSFLADGPPNIAEKPFNDVCDAFVKTLHNTIHQTHPGSYWCNSEFIRETLNLRLESLGIGQEDMKTMTGEDWQRNYGSQSQGYDDWDEDIDVNPPSSPRLQRSESPDLSKQKAEEGSHRERLEKSRSISDGNDKNRKL